MPKRTYFKFAMFLASGGAIFSGMLSGTRFFTNQCTFNEPCPMFLGLSAPDAAFAGYFAVAETVAWFKRGLNQYQFGVSSCIYGALFFALMLATSITAMKPAERTAS